MTIGSFGFMYPAMLVAIPLAIAGLIYAYRQRGRGARTPVASILLLKALQKRSLAPRKFVPPLRFWLELLMLALLISGAAGLYREREGASYAVIIDNSFSMRAISPRDAAGESFFSLA